jgi:hypothetical protein
MRARLTLSSKTLPNLWWALTLGLLSGCSATILDLHESLLPSGPGLEPMRRELAPLRAAFNQHKDQERLMILVSPSCGTCGDLLETIRDSWIPASSNRTALLVFQRVYPQDDEALACSHLRGLPTDRVHAFMDEQRVAASWMTQGCLPLGVGRHLVMIFPAGVEWLEEDPVPSAWCHAMRGLDGSHRIDGQGLALWLEGLGPDVAQGRR